MVAQAADAVAKAVADGRSRQKIELLNPINEKEAKFMNTEPVDYPCSLQKEFDTMCALTKSLLQRLTGATEIAAKRLDDGGVEGEPCAVLYDMPNKTWAAVVFPTADRLNQIKSLAKETNRPLLLVNPQWREEGQVISDFGIGPWKKAAMDFLSQFDPPTYVHKEKRIGNPGTINVAAGNRFQSGGVIRLLRRHPGEYEAYAMAADGSSQLIGRQPIIEPTYQELDALIKQGRKNKLEIFTIAQMVTNVYNELTEGGFGGNVEGEESGGPGSMPEVLSNTNSDDVDAMDAATLRRMLGAYGEPTSGKISKLRERLKEKLASS